MKPIICMARNGKTEALPGLRHMVSSASLAVYHTRFPGRPKCRFNISLNAVEERMRNSLASVTVSAGLVMAGLVGGGETQAQPAPAAQAPAPVAPPDTAALRAQYEQWRTEVKTWGRWAPLGQESKGTTKLITPEKVASAMKLARDGGVVSLAHAQPQTAAADGGP